MPTDAKTIDQIKSLMTESLLELRKIIGADANRQDNFMEVVSLYLHGIISTAADFAEMANPGAKHSIYADIEAGARLGGLRAIHELGVGYSVSDIKPDDMENAMNYLGKAMSTALFKGLYELPKPLQSQEILLRAIEALLTNILNQKFSDPDNPHDILDSFCEHVHMALDDLQKSPSTHQSDRKKKMTATDHIHITPIVENINNHANDLLRNGGGDEELLLSLRDVMGEIKKVMEASTQQELGEYCQKYNGFYRYVRLLDQLAQGIADGTISAPQ